jgi:hypothetical protein
MNFSKKLSILLATSIILILPKTLVHAKASAIDVIGTDGEVYEYNYDALKTSAVDYTIDGSTNLGAKLYSDFLTRKSSIRAFYDDTRNAYVDFSTVSSSAVSSVISGQNFDLDTFLDNTSTPTIILTPTQITTDSSGNLVVGAQSTTSMVNLSTLTLNTTAVPYETIATFQLNVSDPQDYTVTIKGVTATLNPITNIFGAALSGTLATGDFTASDFVVTSKNSTTTPVISEINNITATVNQGDTYSLPTTVQAIMSNGSTENVAVTWDKEANTSQAGTFTFSGTVTGYSNNVILTLTVNVSNTSIVTFTDSNLEQVVRQAINKPTGDIYESDVQNITFLDASNKNIKDISGIQNLTSLQYLDLSMNQISDISALQGLTTLQQLNLNNNQISDISALQGLTNLLTLNLNSNQISNVSVLQGLTNLQELNLTDNLISDVDPLKKLTNLKSLYLMNNLISVTDEQSLKTDLPKCTVLV